jgi:hypothetical protein
LTWQEAAFEESKIRNKRQVQYSVKNWKPGIYLDDLVSYRLNGLHTFVILYADDILLIAQSVNELQKLLLHVKLNYDGLT